MFTTTIITNLYECRTECEILDSDSTVAVVYEGRDGWHVKPLRSVTQTNTKISTPALRQRKSAFPVMSIGSVVGVPEGLTWGGLSLWLMEKDEATASGFKPSEDGPEAAATQGYFA